MLARPCAPPPARSAPCRPSKFTCQPCRPSLTALPHAHSQRCCLDADSPRCRLEPPPRLLQRACLQARKKQLGSQAARPRLGVTAWRLHPPGQACANECISSDAACSTGRGLPAGRVSGDGVAQRGARAQRRQLAGGIRGRLAPWLRARSHGGQDIHRCVGRGCRHGSLSAGQGPPPKSHSGFSSLPTRPPLGICTLLWPRVVTCARRGRGGRALLLPAGCCQSFGHVTRASLCLPLAGASPAVSDGWNAAIATPPVRSARLGHVPGPQPESPTRLRASRLARRRALHQHSHGQERGSRGGSGRSPRRKLHGRSAPAARQQRSLSFPLPGYPVSNTGAHLHTVRVCI